MGGIRGNVDRTLGLLSSDLQKVSARAWLSFLSRFIEKNFGICMHAATQRGTAAQSESMLGVCFLWSLHFPYHAYSKPPPGLGRGYKTLAMGMGFMVQAERTTIMHCSGRYGEREQE